MGIPVKLKADGFSHMGESFKKDEIFNAPHECMAGYLCDQEDLATRVDEKDLQPEKVGTMKRVLKRGAYNTKVMEPAKDGKPAVTRGGSKQGARSKVKAATNAPAENT